METCKQFERSCSARAIRTNCVCRPPCSESAEGLTIRELPRWLNLGLYSYEIEGDPKLLNTEVGGDWIVREDVPAEQLIQPSRRSSSERSASESRCASPGAATWWSPAAGTAIRRCRVTRMGRSESRANSTRTTTARAEPVSSRLSSIGRPSGSDARSSTRWNPRRKPKSLGTMAGADRDLTLVLKHLEEQTGLAFTPEKRPMRILFVERIVTSK